MSSSSQHLVGPEILFHMLRSIGRPQWGIFLDPQSKVLEGSLKRTKGSPRAADALSIKLYKGIELG